MSPHGAAKDIAGEALGEFDLAQEQPLLTMQTDETSSSCDTDLLHTQIVIGERRRRRDKRDGRFDRSVWQVANLAPHSLAASTQLEISNKANNWLSVAERPRCRIARLLQPPLDPRLE